MSALPDAVFNIYGFLSPAEMELLYRLASEVPAGGQIVEIGSFQGKSTVCLGLGAKQGGAGVWAVDPHEDQQASAETRYGMHNHAALLKNLVEFGVADVVRVVALPSFSAISTWIHPVDLLWVDGCHDYPMVSLDLKLWAARLTPASKIALHDSSGHYPGVTQALEEFLGDGRWQIIERVDSTAVLGRCH